MGMVWCKLPRAGLGNQLFPLMKAKLLSSLYDIPLQVTNYNQFSIGPYLRGEKSKRRYGNYFTFQKGVVGSWVDELIFSWKKKGVLIKEHPLQLDAPALNRSHCYLYSEMPHWSDYFAGLKAHRDQVIRLFFEMLRPWIMERVDQQPRPVIGVHIRMGDFRKLQAGEDFSRTGATRTPEQYFMEVIGFIRKVAGRDLPVTIFTDGHAHELAGIFSLPNIAMAEGNADIVDLIMLSRSRVLVTSAGSTFSYWAAFLADAPVIMHPDHIHQPLRPDEVNGKYFEGPVNFSKPDELLLENIRGIGSTYLQS